MKNVLFSFLILFCTFSNAQIVTVPIPGAPGLSVTVGTGINALPLQNIQNNPNAVNITMGDDAWQNVPLPYTFPYFGKNFTNSWMLSNGAVTFQDPTQNAWGMCCSGMDLTTLSDTRYNYTIFGIWTDLIAIQGGTHHYLHQNNSTTFGWYGVSQFYDPNKRNSFEIKIDSSGLVDTRISGALVTGNWVTSGMTGDLTKGEYYQYYHGLGVNIPNTNGISWSALNGTGGDVCISNPLSSPSCPGYAEAFFNQQCSISALYNTACPGYQQAYFNQQCSIDPLYNQSCPGYQQAYFNQQCSLNGLYNTQCPNYAEAYATKQALESSSPPVPVEIVSSSPSQTVAIVSDPIVNQTITSTATTTTPTNPAAAVSLTPSPSQQSSTQQAVQSANTQTNTETKTQSAKTETAPSSTKNTSSNTRQNAQVAQQAREQINSATSLEQQVAVQASVISAMSFVPGFDSYQTVKIIDINALRVQREYGKDVVDNRRLGRGLFGATDSLHQEMVGQQYGR